MAASSSSLRFVEVSGSSSTYFAAMESAFRKPMDALDKEMFPTLTAAGTTCELLFYNAALVGLIAYQVSNGLSSKKLDVSPLWVAQTASAPAQSMYVTALLERIEQVAKTKLGLGWIHIRFPSTLAYPLQVLISERGYGKAQEVAPSVSTCHYKQAPLALGVPTKKDVWFVDLMKKIAPQDKDLVLSPAASPGPSTRTTSSLDALTRQVLDDDVLAATQEASDDEDSAEALFMPTYPQPAFQQHS